MDTSIPALYVTRVLDRIKAERGLPKVLRTDNGPEFAGRAMQTWASRNGVELRFIQPGKPVQNAYIESRCPTSQPLPRRVPVAALVRQPEPHAQRDRQLVRGLQPPPAAQHARVRTAGRVRRALPPACWRQRARPRINNYDANPWALDRSATKPGGSAEARSVPRHRTARRVATRRAAGGPAAPKPQPASAAGARPGEP